MRAACPSTVVLCSCCFTLQLAWLEGASMRQSVSLTEGASMGHSVSLTEVLVLQFTTLLLALLQ